MPPPPASGDLNSHSEPSAWRSPRMSMMRVFVLHPCIPSLKFLGLPFRRYGWFSVTSLSCLLTLTFDLLTSKLGYGLPVSLASFPPIFSFLYSAVLDSWPGRNRHMDGQTTLINALCTPLWEWGRKVSRAQTVLSAIFQCKPAWLSVFWPLEIRDSGANVCTDRTECLSCRQPTKIQHDSCTETGVTRAGAPNRIRRRLCQFLGASLTTPIRRGAYWERLIMHGSTVLFNANVITTERWPETTRNQLLHGTTM